MRWLLLTLLLLLSPSVLAEPVEVEVSGTGATRAAAVANGLAEAIQQVTGVVVEVDQQMLTAVAAAAVNDAQEVSIAASSQDATRRTANGIVDSYRVIETETDEPAHVVLRMTVSVEKFEPKGLSTDGRRRIAVAAFARAAGWRGADESLREKLISYLTQARRFAVLDRANTLVYAQEMATLQDQAPLTERARIGQVIGADYVIVGTIRSGVSRSDRTIEMTGERIVSASSTFDVDWQVLEIPTRQIKWTGTVHLTASGDASSGLIDQAASRIAEEITQALYPMRLIDFSDPAELIVNQGGGTVHPGQRFRAMRLGNQLVDPYTHEPLGQEEREVAVVEIVRVDNKVSYARLVSGKLPDGDTEVVLRAEAPAARRQAPVRPALAPVVRLPGDP